MDFLDGTEKVVTIAATAIAAVTGVLALRGDKARKAVPDQPAPRPAAPRTVGVATVRIAGSPTGTPYTADASRGAVTGRPPGVATAVRALRLTGIPVAVLLFYMIDVLPNGADYLPQFLLTAAAWYLFNLGLAWLLGRGSAFGRGATWVAMVIQMPFYFLIDAILIYAAFHVSAHYAADNMLASVAIAAYTMMVILVLVGLSKPSEGFFLARQR